MSESLSNQRRGKVELRRLSRRRLKLTPHNKPRSVNWRSRIQSLAPTFCFEGCQVFGCPHNLAQ